MDEELRHRYEAWPDKGTEVAGVRATIIPNVEDLIEGDTLRLRHVIEVTTDTVALHPMGPKPVIGEYVDDVRMGPNEEAGETAEPLLYDGLVTSGPGMDAHFEETTYQLDPGSHEIVWRPRPGLTSNRLLLHVRPRDA